MRVRHGRRWRQRAGVPPGRRPRHLLTTAAGATALAAAATGRRPAAGATAVAWLMGTAELAWARIAPGPRSRHEVAAMVATSVAIPPAATWWWLRGWAAVAAEAWRRRGGRARCTDAVLFDRDGTLIEDVPYNGDPDQVVPRPGAADAIERLKQAGVRLAVVSNQSGVARGRIHAHDVDAVNAKVQDLLGPFDVVTYCPHAPDDGCSCRKPSPGMVTSAADLLGVAPSRCVMVGDIGSDVQAGLAAGARAVLVPTGVTRPEEVQAAPAVAVDLQQAVAMILAGAA